MQPLGTQEEKNFCLGGDLALPAQSELVLLSGERGCAFAAPQFLLLTGRGLLQGGAVPFSQECWQLGDFW